MTKTLVLVRHAHRDTADPAADNGLSPMGRRQAKALRRFYERRFGSKGALLISSPKKRCVETLEPLAEELGRKLKTDPRLLEGPRLLGRLEDFLEWWLEEAPRRMVACSHGDWIPEFLDMTIGAALPIKKGGWVELSHDGDSVRLEAFLNEPA